MNLSNLLKDRIGDKFYNPLYGMVKLTFIDADNILYFEVYPYIKMMTRSDGTSLDTGELVIFPSRKQRDWDKYVVEQECPKTWDSMVECGKHKHYVVSTFVENDITNNTPIENSALALLKINQLIDLSYGSYLTPEEWKDSTLEKFIIVPTDEGFKIDHRFKLRAFRHIAFHTKQQAEEFLSYNENKQLLKDFYMTVNQ